MTNHTILAATVLLLAAASLTLAACGGDGDRADASSQTSAPNGDPADEMPPVDADVAASVVAALDGTPLGDWVDLMTAHGVRDDPCSPDPPPMDFALFEAAALLADDVLAELLLNADASYTSARAACEAGDAALASSELTAANQTAQLIAERLSQLRGSQ